MVKISPIYIVKHSDELKCYPIRSKKYSDKDFLKSITHLKLQNRFVDSVESLPDCENVRSVYLQNNLLRSIPNFDCLIKLTHLYLQRNRISKIGLLGSFPSLKKLYLGYNQLAVVEGLESLMFLRELHIQYQDLPMGETIYFDPRTITSLAETLEVLDVSGCQLTSLVPLSGLVQLKELLAENNSLKNLEDATLAVASMPQLQCISLKENPMTSLYTYTDTMIHHGRSLQFLDDVKVNPITRNFIDGWRRVQMKGESVEKPKEKSSVHSRKEVHFTSLNSLTAIPQVFSESLASFPPWILRKNVNTSGKIPQPYAASHRNSKSKI